MTPEEQTIWKGSSSGVVNLGTYLVCISLIAASITLSVILWMRGGVALPVIGGALLLGIIPLFVILWEWIVNRTRVYEVTTERIRIRRGIFTKRTEELELYRVNDTALVEPFWYRQFGAGNIILTTNDVSSPTQRLEAVKGAPDLREQIRKNVEVCRDRKRVRVAEIE